jgi:hypothetical protein
LCRPGTVRTARGVFSSISPARSGWIAPGRTRVHEHAETGKPLAEDRLHGGLEEPRAVKLCFFSPVRPCTRLRWNGPGMVGHKLSAIGLPQHSTRLACSIEHPPWFAAPRGRQPRGSQPIKVSRVVLPAHSFPFRFCASPSVPAAVTDSQGLSDGKVRWQKRFVSPARRMRRGLQF